MLPTIWNRYDDMQKYASIRNGLAEKDSYNQQKRKDKDFQLGLQVIQVIY